MIISLTGFMGCGKSKVGRELSTLLSCPLIDLDEYIVKSQGKSIPEIFEAIGEAGFRALELQSLKEILYATEGGIVSFDGTSPQRYSQVETEPQAVHPSQSKLWAPPSDSAEGGMVSFESTSVGEGGSGKDMVLSLGGGAVTTPECAELIRTRTTCIYLCASLETLMTRLCRKPSSRPLLASAMSDPEVLRAKIRRMMDDRSGIYEATAHHTIHTSEETSPALIAKMILKVL